MKKLLIIKLSLFLLVQTLFLQVAVAVADDEMCIIAKSAIIAASKIRGLKQKKKVPCYVRKKEEVKKYLLDTIEEKMPEVKLANEGTLYKTLGFLPRDFDYKNGIVELYVSQLGGYYDPEGDYFVMAAWMPAALQTTIAVHELTHALQDQEFDLAKLIDPLTGTSDQLMARSALVEGDATAVMFDFSKQVTGQPNLASQENVDSIILQNVAGAAFMTGLQGTPSSLQYMLLFPYTSGLRFVHTLLKRDGYKSIDRAFKSLPRTTEEILHPEKYFRAEKDFQIVADKDLLTKLDDKILYRDTFGEFSVSALLSTFTKDHLIAAKAAEGWGGDTAAIIQKKSGEKLVVWDTRWDTLEDAQEFFNAYTDALEKHYASWKLRKEKSESIFTNQASKQTASLRLKARRVLFIVDL